MVPHLSDSVYTSIFWMRYSGGQPTHYTFINIFIHLSVTNAYVRSQNLTKFIIWFPKFSLLQENKYVGHIAVYSENILGIRQFELLI